MEQDKITISKYIENDFPLWKTKFESNILDRTTTATSALPSSATANGIGNSVTGTGGGVGGNQVLQQLFDDMKQIEDTVDSIEIPARGRCKVFMAKYGYDPFKQSPNDNPDAELAFNAGDYIMVFDDIDEDGYFIGELMDGRRGYVPSNWLDRLVGEDLFEFQATTLYKQSSLLGSATGGGLSSGFSTSAIGTSGIGCVGQINNSASSAKLLSNNNINGFIQDDVDSEINSYPPEFYDALFNDTVNHSNFQHLLAPEDYQRMNDYVDLDDVDEVDDECLSDYERAEAEQMRRAVPPPQRLIIERQLNKSILIGWLHPQAAKGTIVSYQVYVDGVLKSTVPSGDRTKALLEGVDSNIPHRISVRAIDCTGRHSNDAGCTIVIGQKIPFAPSCVKASHITSDSALISWLPCNSNFHHVVAVNSVEVQTVRPGVYKHLINGLSANTLYRVWVRAKPGKILSIDEKNPKKLESLTTYVDFKTMPKSLPDPPVNVQVEAGPQRRTLLVTWLPLTLNDYGNSNGCAVTGYAVFAGHKKLADIDSPTSDHALLDLADLESLHKKSVTVRTKSGENLSQDSMPCHIPDEYLKAAHKADVQHSASSNQLLIRHGNLQQQQQHQQHSSHQSANNHLYSHHHNQRLSSDSAIGGHQSPLTSRHHHNQQQKALHGARANRLTNSNIINNRGRQLARSLQNLESDLDSRRSSIPAIEITRDHLREDLHQQPWESYSEEEFENSMRFRGGLRSRRSAGAGGPQRYRTRQSQSVDSSVNHLGTTRYQSGSLTKLRSNTGGNTPNTGGLIDNRDIRYFVALFDYDPSTMSPNPNAASEELAFKEGSIIKIIGDKGPDGFYRGESDGYYGFVPCNVVSEITDPNILFNLQEKNRLVMQQQQQAALLSQQQQQQHHQQLQQHNQQQRQIPNSIKRMIALYDYDPQENSPNADTESEIPFKVGDVIYVYGKMDADGFYMGEIERTKQTGLVPSNFLREEPLPPNAKLPESVILAQQQLLLQQQKPFVNQMGVFVNNNTNSSNPMLINNPTNVDPYQQNCANNNLNQQQQQQLQKPYSNQANTSAVQLQQQHQQLAGNIQMDSLNNQQMQQQQLNKIGNNQAQQMRPNNIRAINPNQNPNQQQPMFNQQQQQNNPQQNINRPTTLSLGLNANSNNMSNSNQQLLLGNQQMNDWNNNNRQQMIAAGLNPQQQQQQHPQALNQIGQQNQVNMMNQAHTNQPQQQFSVGVNPNMGPIMQHGNLPMQQANMSTTGGLKHQQQQNPASGFVSNLLSSGKQIIGAATTPRAPNQPGQFPSVVQSNNMNNINNSNQMMNGPMMDNSSALIGGAGLNSNFATNRGGNLIQNAYSANDPSSQIHNSFNMTGGGCVGPGLNINHQQNQMQQPFNPASMGMNRGVGGGAGLGGIMGSHPQTMGGDGEQGGNILNTVKNIFKL